MNFFFFKANLGYFLKYSSQQEPMNLVFNFKLLFIFSKIFIKIYSLKFRIFFTSNYGGAIKIDFFGYKEYLFTKSG